MRRVFMLVNFIMIVLAIYTAYNIVQGTKINLKKEEQKLNKVNVSFEEIKGIEHQKEWIKKVLDADEKPNGILLYGPPGTGKTMLAKAICTHYNGNFIPVTAGMIQSKFYGETPKLIEDLFRQAEKTKPSVLFFDEMDGFFNDRDFVLEQSDRCMKTTLLSCMDGIVEHSGIIFIGATNRLSDIDPAIKRRFRMQIEVPLPSREVLDEMLICEEACGSGSGVQTKSRSDILDELIEREFSCSDVCQLNKMCKIDAGKDQPVTPDIVDKCLNLFF